MARSTSLKSKLSPKSLGNPRKGADVKEGERFHLGRIMGVANGVKTGNDATGNPYVGLRGSFEATPADETKDIVQAGVCFLPPGITELVIAQINAVPEGQAVNIGFAFDIYTKPAKSPAGYEYDTVPVLKAESSDPLAGLREAIADQKAPAIEDKSKAKK